MTTNNVSNSFSNTSATSSFPASMPNNIVDQGSFPKIILKLMEQGHTSADAQIRELVRDIQYSENIYALKYILEHKGASVSVEVLQVAMKSLYCVTQETDEVF